MKLHSLEIEGFRSFSTKVQLDLNADVVLLSGPNGTGKTSILDSVLWALSGSVPRLGKEAGNIVSRYAPHGFAEVSVSMSNGSGPPFGVKRRFDGSTTTVSVEHGQELLKGKRAELFLLEQLWPQASEGDDNFEALGAVLAQFVYLQQDLVTQFIEGHTETDRFKALGELVGVGRLYDLQGKLESARNAWTRTTNQKTQELEERVVQLNNLQLHLDRLSAPDKAQLEEIKALWSSWWQKAREIWLGESSSWAFDSPDASVRLDSSLRELQTEIANTNRRLSALEVLVGEASSLIALSPPSNEEISLLESTIQNLAEKLHELNGQLLAAKERSASERKRIMELQESTEELRAFAILALRHLEDQCPVCKQGYDRDEAKRRLEELASRQGGQVQNAPDVEATVRNLSGDANVVQSSLLAEQQRLLTISQSKSQYESRLLAIQRGLQDFGVSSEDELDIARLQFVQSTIREKIGKLKELYVQGEKLLINLARLGEQNQRAEIQAQRNELESQVALLRTRLDGYVRTGQTASKMIEGLRDVTALAVQKQIENVEPLLTKIYSRIDPHPAFTLPKFKAWQSRGRGRMNVLVEDTEMDVKGQDPVLVLSSSQKNALAVSLFLTFNLGSAVLPFKVAMLDDPLQNLDDVNLLGLVDVLRRVRSKRQLIISTHDERFSQLLCRKLRPIEEEHKTLIVRLDSWTRKGPEFSVSDVERPHAGLRVLTA